MSDADLNKERLELALEAAGLDLWENNLLTGEVTRKASKTFEELGFTEEEIVADVQGIYGLFHPDDLPRVQKAVEDHLSGRTAQYRCEFRLRSKQGEWIWFANYGRIMDGRSASPGQRLIGVTFNIDDRKRQEDEIAQINRQLVEQNALLQQLNTTLRLLAANDSLTGLSNRRTLMELGESECRRAERFGHRREDRVMRAVPHQVHQPDGTRLLSAKRKTRMEVQNADRPGWRRLVRAHACGSSAAHASIAARASGSSMVGA